MSNVPRKVSNVKRKVTQVLVVKCDSRQTKGTWGRLGSREHNTRVLAVAAIEAYPGPRGKVAIYLKEDNVRLLLAHRHKVWVNELRTMNQSTRNTSQRLVPCGIVTGGTLKTAGW